MTAKRDFKRELECYRATRNSPQVTDVPDLQYLMIDGHGDPNTPVHLAVGPDPMIIAPHWITAEMVTDAVGQVGMKDRPTRLDDLRLEVLSEGCCVQALHVGAYDDEAELLRYMHEGFIPGRGLDMVGKHHEIHLSDPRRVEPARLRTILRQPVAGG